MTDKQEYKEALGRLDNDTRRCLLYLEGLLDEKFRLALKVKQPPVPKVDFSSLESKDDSLQKQIDGLRQKVDTAYSHVQKHEEDKIFLKILAKKADEVLGEVKSLFDELYASGFFKRGSDR